MTAQLDAFAALDAARARVAAKHAAALARYAPLARACAQHAGEAGVTVGDIRLWCNLPTGDSRALSWLVALPRAAGLVKTGRRRLSLLPGTRNVGTVWVHPDYAAGA